MLIAENNQVRQVFLPIKTIILNGDIIFLVVIFRS